MKILPKLRIYDSLSLEVNKSESELLDILKSKTKRVAHFADGDKILMMNRRDGNLFFDTTRLGVSIENTDAEKSALKFDFYTRYPAILKTVAIIVMLFFSIFFIAILSMGDLAAVKDKPGFFLELFIYFLKFMLTFPVLAILIYITEKVNRYTTKTFIKSIIKDM